MSDEWICEYDKNSIQVLLKSMKTTNVTRVKVRGIFPDVSPKVLYQSLIHDEYVRHCDPNMAEWEIVEQIDESNDISYYASKLPSLMKFLISPRDFLSIRGYGETGPDEYMIIMRSIEDQRKPTRKKWVRAHILITGFLIQKCPDGGTQLTYLSQTDLKGKIPTKIINYATTKLAPSIVRQFESDALKFPEWERTKMKTKTLPICKAYKDE